jgi:aminopeptidase-like protein
MLDQILSTLSPAISGERAVNDITAIWSLDRWCSFERHHETSRLCRRKLAEAGVESEIIPVPADGKTVFGDWVMPQAWNVRKAALRLLAGKNRGEQVLCDYQEEPCSLIIYSAPTPRRGVTAELVVMEGGAKDQDYAGVDVRGKIILTAQGPEIKEQALKHGALGIITDHMPEYEGCRPRMALPAARAWQRFGPDFPHGGWGMKKGHTQCWGFVLSPRLGSRLREQSKLEPALRLHAEVDARFYDGTLDLVMGRIPGRTSEEVLINGHLSEVGALDNASGCGLALEILRALNGLIARGVLSPPQRGIRMLFTYESMGTMAAALLCKDIFRNVVAGLTLDCVGGREALCRAPLDLCRNPGAQSSYTDTLMRMVLERQSASERLLVNWRDRPFANADNLIADPTIGVPCPLLMECPYTAYHSSADVPAILDPEKLAWIGRAAAAYVYFIASAGEAQARWLAEQVLTEGVGAVARLAGASRGRSAGSASAAAAPSIRSRLDYLGFRYSSAIDSVARLVRAHSRTAFLKSLQPLKRHLSEFIRLSQRRTQHSGSKLHFPQPVLDASSTPLLVPKRLVAGQLRMTRIGRAEQEAWKAMCARNGVSGAAVLSAQFWADGKRTVGEIEQLVACETGSAGGRLSELFKYLEKYGYVKLRRRLSRATHARRAWPKGR